MLTSLSYSPFSNYIFNITSEQDISYTAVIIKLTGRNVI